MSTTIFSLDSETRQALRQQIDRRRRERLKLPGAGRSVAEALAEKVIDVLREEGSSWLTADEVSRASGLPKPRAVAGLRALRERAQVEQRPRNPPTPSGWRLIDSDA